MCLQFNINFHLFSPVLQLSQAGREIGSLTRKPALAQADSPVRKNSPGVFGTSGWYSLFRNDSNRDLEHCCPLQMVAHCQIPSLHTPKPTLALSCTLKTIQFTETKEAMPVYTSKSYDL